MGRFAVTAAADLPAIKTTRPHSVGSARKFKNFASPNVCGNYRRFFVGGSANSPIVF